MARVYTYSFEDTTVTIAHPNYGNYSAYGTGIGQLDVAYTENETEHNVAADLSVVVSKHAYKHGTIEFQILQSSDFNAWLKKFTSWLENQPTSQWALATINIKNASTGETYYATGVSPQKRANDSFQSAAQLRTWTMMCANITNS